MKTPIYDQKRVRGRGKLVDWLSPNAVLFLDNIHDDMEALLFNVLALLVVVIIEAQTIFAGR